jgi:hypothetical protein
MNTDSFRPTEQSSKSLCKGMPHVFLLAETDCPVVPYADAKFKCSACGLEVTGTQQHWYYKGVDDENRRMRKLYATYELEVMQTQQILEASLGYPKDAVVGDAATVSLAVEIAEKFGLPTEHEKVETEKIPILPTDPKYAINLPGFPPLTDYTLWRDDENPDSGKG